jgi:hypothetical protein
LARPARISDGVGNTRSNATDFASLIGDVENKIFDRLPDETWFYRDIAATRRSARNALRSLTGTPAVGSAKPPGGAGATCAFDRGKRLATF